MYKMYKNVYKLYKNVYKLYKNEQKCTTFSKNRRTRTHDYLSLITRKHLSAQASTGRRYLLYTKIYNRFTTQKTGLISQSPFQLEEI